jgi:hypothetical protein
METSASSTEAVFLSGALSPKKRLAWGNLQAPPFVATQRRSLSPGSLAGGAYLREGVQAMERISPCCCGLDVHKKTMVVCLWVAGQPKELESFRATTQELLRLHDWLQAAGWTHMAREATGVSGSRGQSAGRRV